MASFLQGPKKSKLLDGARKLFSRQIHQKRRQLFWRHLHKYVFLQEFLYRNWLICFQTIWKVSRSSKHFPDHPKGSKPSGKSLNHPESFQMIRKFPDHPESFETIRKVSRSSRKFPDDPESFQTNQKYVHFVMFFNAGFQSNVQKLSG